MSLVGQSAAGTSQYKRQTAINSTRDMLHTTELTAKERVINIDHTTVAADGNGAANAIVNLSEINLCVLQAGSTIDLKRTYLKLSANAGDATDLRLGLREYKRPDGTTVAEDANAICVFTDLGNSATLTRHYFGTGESSITPGTLAGTLGLARINSREPVTLFAKAANASGTFSLAVGTNIRLQLGYFAE